MRAAAGPVQSDPSVGEGSYKGYPKNRSASSEGLQRGRDLVQGRLPIVAVRLLLRSSATRERPKSARRRAAKMRDCGSRVARSACSTGNCFKRWGASATKEVKMVDKGLAASSHVGAKGVRHAGQRAMRGILRPRMRAWSSVA